MFRINKWAALIMAALMLTGCSSSDSSSGDNTSAVKSSVETSQIFSEDSESSEDVVYITLDPENVKLDSKKPERLDDITASGQTVTIKAAGKYYATGKLTDGQIIVNTSKEDKVELYLDGADITCTTSAPIRIESADGCTIHLVEGSTNVVNDGAANSVSACISAKDDLTIKGSGSLVVNGSSKHGIKSSNDVRIKNGDITVSAVSAGVYGEDTVQITGGKLTVTSCKDGLKSFNEEEAARGVVTIEDGDIDIQNASGNGIEASNSVEVTGGKIRIHCMKTTVNCDNQKIAEGCLEEY